MVQMGAWCAVSALVFCVHTADVRAFEPIVIEDATPVVAIPIDDITRSRMLYGDLDNFPHTYEFSVTKPTALYAQVLVPDIASAKNTVSAIIIRLPDGRGRVTEVARLEAKDAMWTREFEPWVGDSYRSGSMFEKEIGPGTYRIEVHTPDNVEKYALRVGTRDDMEIGYIERVRRIVAVKAFFEKSPLRVIESRYVYMPIAVLVLCVGAWSWYKRRKSRGV